jgi:hypothetical protein
MDVARELIGGFRQARKSFKRPRTISNGDDDRLDEKGHWPVPSGSADRLCVEAFYSRLITSGVIYTGTGEIHCQ